MKFNRLKLPFSPNGSRKFQEISDQLVMKKLGNDENYAHIWLTSG